MRWILILSFIVVFAPLAGAQSSVDGGGVQSMDLSSHGAKDQLEGSFNEPSKEAEYKEVSKQLDLDSSEAHPNTAILDGKSTH